MLRKQKDGPRILSLDLNEQSAEAFRQLKNRYHLVSDAEVINKALTLLDVAGHLMDDSGTLVVGEGGNKKKIHMRQ